jgi:hypothetical protein
MVESTAMAMERRVPVGAGKVREVLTLPKGLAVRVRAFRFRREFEQKSDAYIWLLEQALNQVEREEEAETKERKK